MVNSHKLANIISHPLFLAQQQTKQSQYDPSAIRPPANTQMTAPVLLMTLRMLVSLIVQVIEQATKPDCVPLNVVAMVVYWLLWLRIYSSRGSGTAVCTPTRRRLIKVNIMPGSRPAYLSVFPSSSPVLLHSGWETWTNRRSYLLDRPNVHIHSSPLSIICLVLCCDSWWHKRVATRPVLITLHVFLSSL
jgi:hypothetical protein